MVLNVRNYDASDNRLAQQRATKEVQDADNAVRNEQAMRYQQRQQSTMMEWES